MNSPFPGMDPYLEQIWGGVHNNLITFAQIMLNERSAKAARLVPRGSEPGQNRPAPRRTARIAFASFPVSRLAQNPYKVCVCRGGKASAEIYRVPLREPLPAIRVPLRPNDADVALELQTLIAQVYHHGRYDDIDYTVPPVPPLEGEDAAWADELLRAAGKRPPKAV